MPKPNMVRRILLDIEKCRQAPSHMRANPAILHMCMAILETS